MGRRKKYNTCKFCGLSQPHIGLLLEGKIKDSFICGKCARLASDIIIEKDRMSLVTDVIKEIPNPKKIVSYLDQYVVGQEQTKKNIAVAVHNHYKRLSNFNNDVEIEKSNILMIGPTGTGKTLFAKIIAKFLNVPFALGDATSLTAEGYVGQSISSLLFSLLNNCDFNIQLAEMGIVYIDEIDKLAASGPALNVTKEVSTVSVQQGLLKMIEGHQMEVPITGGRRHPHKECVTMNTSNILFICGGSFCHLDDIIKKRIGKKQIGFGTNASENNASLNVTTEDLVEFGLIPEFIGRLPIITKLEPLDKPALRKILTEPKNALIKQYQRLFAMEGCELDFSDCAIESIVDLAIKQNTGARGLRSIVEKTMLDIMFDLPDAPKDKYVVTKDTISGKKLFDNVA